MQDLDAKWILHLAEFRWVQNSLCVQVLHSHLAEFRWWRGGATGKAFGLAISRSRVQIMLEATRRNNLRQVVYTCASVTKQYKLVPAKGRWCSAAGEVTAGLAESNCSLPGGWLTVTCRLTACVQAVRLTACTPGSAPGPTLGIEYRKPLPSPF